MEWHVWDFPDNIRINFSDEFREKLFENLKKICGSRCALARILNLHPMTIKEYELGRSSMNHPVFMSVKVLKEIKQLFEKELGKNFLQQAEKSIIAYRCRGGGLGCEGSLVHNPVLPIKESPDFYSIASHLLGDGCASKNSTPNYCNRNKILLKNFTKKIKSFGGFQVRVFNRPDGVTYIYFPTAIARILQFILDIKFVRPDSFPQRLMATSSENKAAGIRAFMDDEGSVSGGKIYVTQKSENMLVQLKALFESLGIKTSKIYKKKYGCYRSHQFIILSESYEAFSDIVSFNHPKKKRRLEKIINKRKNKPKPIKHRVLELVKEYHPLNTHEVAEILNLRINSAGEALTTLREERKILNHRIHSRKPWLWYPKEPNG